MTKRRRFAYKLLAMLLLFSLCKTNIKGQPDSTQIGGFAGIRGMWQTGNLNQVSLIPNGKAWLTHPNHYAELLATFHYIKVSGFEVKNDLWSNSLYQYKPENRFFPSAQVVTGTAVSFRINHSILAGIGGGVNVIRKRPTKYLQVHLYTSYLNFEFEGESPLRSFAIGTNLRANIPLNKWLNFHWELGSYHSMKETDFWGGSNLLQLSFRIGSKFSMNLSHQTYHNQHTITNIKNTNTQTLWGCQYSF